ncbi:L-lactate dehydrogenase [Fervidobacterium changbaicum]|uniref:L-lactate dehydrogenase n=1 Tax=Fervidobacterium changbaicum TaxID=310769 RepID=A0ABX5QRI9_9BACT|nr:L-lactate dehydrogenase [Fervidobacterium changbaicum]QAV33089.1 L-lactate dehydrogenase [Fervidobacterium changbaicum]SDH03656.1 L-lactate dehydrogenase [Fervidobacterium changbaicum]
MKVSIYGAGRVGVSVAFSLLHYSIVDKIVMVDIDKNRSIGEAMDLLHASGVFKYCNIYAGDPSDIIDSDFVVITAGRAQRPGETRLDLLIDNVKIIKSISEDIKKYAKDSIVINITNPVDVLTYLIWEFTEFDPRKIIGTGTTLDTLRLRTLLAQQCGVSSASIHAYIIGEHGDSEFMPLSSATIGGVLLRDYCADCDMKAEGSSTCLDFEKIVEEVRTAAYKIIEKKGATNLAIGAITAKLIDSIWKNEKRVWTPSVLIDDVYIGFPAVLGRNGVEKIVKLKLVDEEQELLEHSKSVIRKAIEEIKKVLETKNSPLDRISGT